MDYECKQSPVPYNVIAPQKKTAPSSPPTKHPCGWTKHPCGWKARYHLHDGMKRHLHVCNGSTSKSSPAVITLLHKKNVQNLRYWGLLQFLAVARGKPQATIIAASSGGYGCMWVTSSTFSCNYRCGRAGRHVPLERHTHCCWCLLRCCEAPSLCSPPPLIRMLVFVLLQHQHCCCCR